MRRRKGQLSINGWIGFLIERDRQTNSNKGQRMNGRGTTRGSKEMEGARKNLLTNFCFW